MGGIGSGARRSTHIGNVEEMLALDIRVLRRLGVVRAGECVCDTVRWSTDGLSASSARLRVDLSDIERGGTIAITGDMSDGTIKQRVAIEGVPSRNEMLLFWGKMVDALGAVCIHRIQIMAHARWTKPMKAEMVFSHRKAILRKRLSLLKKHST